MNKKKLDKFKAMLNKKMQDLISEANDAMGGMTETKENFADPTDLASFESDQNFLLRIGDRKRKLILKIRGVLDKVDDGSFGICEICGEPIPEERLMARPETTQCIECKTEMEEQEKRARVE
jgi:DnaK suppressor protein